SSRWSVPRRNACSHNRCCDWLHNVGADSAFPQDREAFRRQSLESSRIDCWLGGESRPQFRPRLRNQSLAVNSEEFLRFLGVEIVGEVRRQCAAIAFPVNENSGVTHAPLPFLFPAGARNSK